MMKVTAFRWVPPFAQGLVRDLRVRWALEEAKLPYQMHLLGPDEPNSESYRRWQPFGQVPAVEDGNLRFFESGAIVLHIAEQSPALMPEDLDGKTRARTWVFAAINSVEQYIGNLTQIDLFNADKAWAKERRPEVLKMVRERLGDLSRWLNGRNYLEGDRFTVGDLMMASVLRNLRHIDILEKEFPPLAAYLARCQQRPAFQKALADQMKTFAENAPAQ